METLHIDLGEKMPDCCCPVSAPPMPKNPEPKVFYPELHFRTKKELDLPSEGQLLVSYRTERRAEETIDEETRHSYDLEILSVDGVEGDEKPVNSKKTPEDDFEDRRRRYQEEEGE